MNYFMFVASVFAMKKLVRYFIVLECINQAVEPHIFTVHWFLNYFIFLAVVQTRHYENGVNLTTALHNA